MRQGSIDPAAGEAGLYTALAAGDGATARAFVAEHRPKMLRLASRVLADIELAEEVVQDTLESVFAGIGRFRREAKVQTWAYRILLHRARRVWRRERRSVAFSRLERAPGAPDGGGRREMEPPPGAGVHGAPAVDPLTSAIHRQRLRLVAEGLGRLPERQRAIVVMRDIEGRDSHKVAARLEISPGNERVLLHRGRLAIRAGIERSESFGAGGAAEEGAWS